MSLGKYLVCITGASGSVYGIRLMRALVEAGHEVHGIVSVWGAKVLERETGRPFSSWAAELGIPRDNVYAPDDLGALPASGSFKLDGTVVVPCSVSSAGAVASGVSLNLIHRAAQTALKEGRPLVLVPRETPLSLPVLRNFCTLAEAGAAILPACPAFYHAPKTMDDLTDFVVAKILDRLSVAHKFNTSWRGFT
jgi:4-hydroxy-3-polyprenylbenzoate decarboxylase